MIRFALAGAMLFAAAISAAAAKPVIEAGKPFPLVRLPLVGDEEKLTSIEPYRGRKLMLHLFASW